MSSSNKMSNGKLRRIKNKENAIIRKSNKIKDLESNITNSSRSLYESLGADTYEKLRTGTVKLNVADRKTVNEINSASLKVKKKKEKIKKKQEKIKKLKA